MSDMRLQMIITGNNRALNQMLDQSSANIRRFTQGAANHFTGLQEHARKVWSAINGMSAATKLVGAAIGVGSLKSVIDDNLELERTLLKIKFNAGMTTKELAELRKMALDLSKTSLNTPLEIAQMQLRLANAGLKMDEIRKLAPTVANAAQVFEAPAGEIADLVFDKITKSGIREDRVPQMLDMLYFHATSGRFETMDMARQAPVLLNAGAQVGLTGETGLNLMGALTQRMMRNATVQNPAEVATLVENGLAHITQPHYVKGLAKVGINLPSFFDKKGHFKGEGGVDGLIALTRAMMAKGLDNPFKLGEAGFREHYTQTFWLEMMRSLKAKDTDQDPNLLKMMERGKEAMSSGQLAINLATMREANFGKIKAAEIQVDKMKLSEAGQSAAKGAGVVAETFSEHPAATIAAGAAAYFGGKYLLNKLLNGGGAAAGDALGKVAGAAAVPVLVTNWPSSLTGPIRASERLNQIQQRGASAASGAGAGAGAAGAGAARAAGMALLRVAPVLALSGDSANTKYDPDWDAKLDADMAKKGMHREKGWIFDSFVPDKPTAPASAGKPQTKLQQLAAPADQGKGLDPHVPTKPADKAASPGAVVDELRKVGEKIDALGNRPVVARVDIDGRQVAEAVNKVNGRDARRQ